MVSELLERLAAGLAASPIPYMVIGGQAVLLHGGPRFTKVIDVTLGIGPESLDKVLAVVKALNCSIRVPSPGEFVEQTMVLPCHDPVTDLDIDLVFSHSPYERQAIARARVIPMGKNTVRFSSPEDLVIHKIFAGRPRDLEDVRAILLKNPNMDRDYVEKWLKVFERDLGEPYSRRFAEILKQAHL